MARPPQQIELLEIVRAGLSLSADDAAAVAEELEPVTCRGGAWLFRQGDPADSLYLLVRGRLQVWIDSSDPERPEPRLVAEVAPGETVGEIGLLTGGVRSAGIRALRDCLLLRLDAQAFDRLAARRPALSRQLAGGIAVRLRDRTAGTTAARRPYRTIALLPLDPGTAIPALARRLADALARRGPVRLLGSAEATQAGPLELPAGPGEPVSTRTVEWLADEEDRHRFVLYVADPGATPWTDLVLRHADLVLLVAEAGRAPERRDWEGAVLDPPHGTIAPQALLLLHEGSPARPTGMAGWLQGRPLDFHLHLRQGDPGDFARLARILDGSATGLVLGGGAARGFAHLGVYRAMIEGGHPVDWVCGSSIGSVMAAAIAMYVDPQEIIDRGRTAFVDGRPFSDLTLPVTSLLSGRRLERLLGTHLGGRIEDLPIPYFCVSSTLGTGQSQLHERGSLPQALRASVSIPGVFPPAVIDGQLVIDGGILDNLPVDRMRSRPVGRVVAVDVTSRQNYGVDYDAVPSPWAVLAGRYLPMRRRYRVPGFMTVLLKAAEIGTMAAARDAGRRADLLLRPDVGRYGITEVTAYDAIVAAGYETGRAALGALPRDPY